MARSLIPKQLNVFSKKPNILRKDAPAKILIFKNSRWQTLIIMVFLKTLNKRKYTTRSLFLTKLQASCLQLCQKRDSGTDVFLRILQIF